MKKLKLFGLYLLLAASTALADEAQMPRGAIAPKPSGPPHSCTKFDELGAILKGANLNSKTKLAYRIGTDGKPKNIAVEASSGNPDVDQLAISCASNYQYEPATLNGQPIEVPWNTIIRWCVGDPACGAQTVTVSAKPIRTTFAGGIALGLAQSAVTADHALSDPAFVPPTLSLREEDMTKAGLTCSQVIMRIENALHPNEQIHNRFCYRVGEDGDVKDVYVLQPSVSSTIDSRLAWCVYALKYSPATQNGKPVDAIMSVPFNLCLKHGPCDPQAPLSSQELETGCQKFWRSSSSSGH